MFKKIKHLHLVGIGGTGMCGIAQILLNRGYKITGSDLVLTDVTHRLEKLGAVISEGHKKENVKGADVLVISSAVKSDNPEVVAAREFKIPVIRRAEMLAELMRMKYGIGIAGTHGKTTTTSMTGMVLTEGDFDPTVIVGGRVHGYGSNARIGEGEFLVLEADEYDRTFLELTPSIAVVTNIESEHLDCYKNLDDIKQAFVTFANKVPFYGSVIICLDDDGAQSILPNIRKPLITYGLSPQADIRAYNVRLKEKSAFYKVASRDGELGEIKINVPGVHNVRNSLAAVAIGLELGVPFDKIQKGLEKFTGVHRRFEVKGEVRDIMVVDDYAHHPTEIQATLKGVKEGWEKRLIAVFQPHLYSRTRDFCVDFGRSFYQADVLVVTDVYPAREKPIEGVTGELVSDAAKKYGHHNVLYIKDKADIPDKLLEITQPNDIVITMGAGDIWKYGEGFLERLKE